MDEHVRNQDVSKITKSSWECSMVREMFLLHVLREQDGQPAAAMGQPALLYPKEARKQPGLGYDMATWSLTLRHSS